MKERPETRLTVVFGGKRIFEKYNCTILEDIQDDGRTLKLFVGCSHETSNQNQEKITEDKGNTAVLSYREVNKLLSAGSLSKY